MHLSAIILLLSLLFLVECNAYAFVGQPHYIRTGVCKVKNVCLYAYEADFVHALDVESQNLTVTASFEVSCDSTGEYAYQKATKYCISVTEGFLEHKGTAESGTTELVQQLGGWFCFVQTENGKIPIVSHSSNETQNVVNFKKALISGFQANFAGTDEVEETDPDTVHMSHYRYIVEPETNHRSGHMLRYFDQNDILRTAAGHQSLVSVGYTKEEELLYSDGVLSHAHGETYITIPQKKQHRRTSTSHHHDGGKQESLLDNSPQYDAHAKRNIMWGEPGEYHQSTQSYYPNVNLNQFTISSMYTLDLLQCSAKETQRRRRRRNVQESTNERLTETMSSLKATDSHEHYNINDFDVTSVLEHIYNHASETEQVQALKSYLSMEDQLDSTPGINEAVDYLNQICLSTNEVDISMKQKMYPILASLTNDGAQQALLSCVGNVRSAAELNSLLTTIALLVKPGYQLVTQLQSMIDAGSVSNTDSLLLVYGALASRADHDLQAHMVAYLSDRLLEKSTEDKDEMITLINALGNSGSAPIIDSLLSVINDNDDFDIQLMVINALRKQTNNPRVLATFLDILKSINPDPKIVAAIINTLISGLETLGVTDVEATITIARELVTTSRGLENSYISEILSYYLNQLRELGVVSTSRRLRRGTNNWMQSGTEYDIIASYEDRQEDGHKYPNNSAFLWTQKIGVNNFNLQIAAGMFTGASESGNKQKVLGRLVGRVNTFGHFATAVEIEVLRTMSLNDDFLHKVVYVTVGGYMLLHFESFTDDKTAPTEFDSGTEYPLLEFDLQSFVGVATVTTKVSVYAQLDSYFEVNAISSGQLNSFYTNGLFSSLINVRLEGSSTFDVLGTQGGIDLNGKIGYWCEADGTITGCEYGSPPVFVVSTEIDNQFENSYVKLSSWIKPHKIVPCGFEECIWEGDKVQDGAEIERWMMNASNAEKIWSHYVYIGTADDRNTCPPRPEEEPVYEDWQYNSNDGGFPSWPDDSRP